MNGRITPGSHPELNDAAVQDIAEQWNISGRTFEETRSFTGRVFMTKDDGKDLPGYVIKVPSSNHTPERVRFAQKVVEATQGALEEQYNANPSFGQIAVQQFYSLPNQPNRYSVPVGEDGEHIAVMANKLPGHTSTEQPRSIRRQHAAILGIMHRAMQAPGLVEYADTHNIGLESAMAYTDLYMRPLEEDHSLLEEMAPWVDKINEYWDDEELLRGGVLVDPWINNMLRNNQDQITAAIDAIDANKAPRGVDLGIALFGLYAKKRSFRQLLVFVDVYDEHARPHLTALERAAWVDLTILRGFTSRHGAELVNREGAEKDKETIEQLIADAEANGAI